MLIEDLHDQAGAFSHGLEAGSSFGRTKVKPPESEPGSTTDYPQVLSVIVVVGVFIYLFGSSLDLRNSVTSGYSSLLYPVAKACSGQLVPLARGRFTTLNLRHQPLLGPLACCLGMLVLLGLPNRSWFVP